MVLIEENHNTNDAGIAGRFRQVGPGTTVSRNFNHGNWRGQSTQAVERQPPVECMTHRVEMSG